MSVQAVIVAAGAGRRLKSQTPKPFVLLKKRPLIIHVLRIFQAHRGIRSIIVVAPKKYIRRFCDVIRCYKITKVKKVVAGGKLRRDSVENGLAALDKDAKYVLIHDGGRPFADCHIVDRVLAAAKKYKAAVAAVPLKPTLKRIGKDKCVQETLDRTGLWEIQTPQGFSKELILRAHTRNRNFQATDDAVLVERLGKKVKVVLGSYRNIKITTPEDLVMAQALLAAKK